MATHLGLPSGLVLGQVDAGDGAEGPEELLQVGLACVLGQVRDSDGGVVVGWVGGAGEAAVGRRPHPGPTDATLGNHRLPGVPAHLPPAGPHLCGWAAWTPPGGWLRPAGWAARTSPSCSASPAPAPALGSGGAVRGAPATGPTPQHHHPIPVQPPLSSRAPVAATTPRWHPGGQHPPSPTGREGQAPTGTGAHSLASLSDRC